MEMISVAAIMHQTRSELNLSIDDYSHASHIPLREHFIAVLGGAKGKAFDVHIDADSENGAPKVLITPLESSQDDAAKQTEVVEMEAFQWTTEAPLANVQVNHRSGPNVSNERLVQYEGRSAEGYRIRFNGSQQEIIFRTPEEHALYTHMLPPEKKDFSKFLLCPMPGTLISLSKFILFLLLLLSRQCCDFVLFCTDIICLM